MEFCPHCDNYIFVNYEKVGDKFKVIHKCNNCGYTSDKTKELKEDSCMYNNPHNINKLQYYVKHKENIKYDPTIPHIDVIPCPNKSCVCNTSDTRSDVLYINLDVNKLYMLYICNHCSTHWTNQ